jgi:predicted nucleic acid-binding protein
VDAFDADVLIYAAAPAHPLGRRIRALFVRDPIEEDPGGGEETVVGIGSVLLLPEILAKPLRARADDEVAELAALLARLELRPTDRWTASVAASLAAAYGLRAADAVHLATAVVAGADRFLTNNRRDFPKSIVEVDITYPEDLPTS